jgi:lipopolysaccharide export system protein LptA
VWTPKRAVLLLAGSGLFLVAYFVYAYFLGGIDGLPPLPEPFVRRAGEVELKPPPPPIESDTDKWLKQAFGLECKELQRTIKLIVPNRGLIVATNHAVPEPDGRFKLTPFSVAIFRHERDETKFPEINTARSEVAYLRFDKPITNIMSDIGNRKITGAELKGTIVITSNRGSAPVSDDIEIRVDRQALFFDEDKSKIWSDGVVTLLDKETRPHPTKIRGQGMDLWLLKEAKTAPPGKKAPPRNKGEIANGVERVVLRADVDMHLYTGFLTPDKKERGPKFTAPGQKNDKPDKSHVVISTPGSFTYDLTKDLAWFDCPPSKGLPERIHVIQEPLRDETIPKSDQIDQKWNQLMCDYLELQFRRKNTAPSAKPNSRSTDRDIDHARATARSGREVTLTMDLENLHAQCAELLYYSATEARGSQTILKGDNLEVFKDAHRIRARELVLVGADQKGNGQQLMAKGPGQVDLYDRNNEAKPYPRHAVWKDLLTFSRIREDKREFDLLTLTEEARFVDEEHEQELQGERLLVWLDPEDRISAETKQAQMKQPSATSSQHRPQKVEAFDRVKVHSPEFIVRDCRHLLILFEEGRESLPEAIVRKEPAPPDHKVERPGLPALMPLPKDKGPIVPPMSGAPQPLSKAPDKDKKRQPMQLWSRDVQAKIARLGQKSDLRNLIADGTVHVHQDGSEPGDKGVDIKGEILTLDHHPSGSVLVVKGDGRGPAQLQLGELFLVGPKVTINQQKNEAKVEGIGAMHMPSNTSFEGGKAAKPGTRLTVHWTNDMFFDGQGADFHGGVVAYQDTSSMKCETLSVTFDKVISLKEGQKNGQSAKVEKLVAHGKVYIADTVHDDKKALKRYQRLMGHQVEFDHLAGPANVTGPGRFYLLQPGTIEPVRDPKRIAPPPLPPGPKRDDKNKEMTLTRVDFEDHMFSNNKTAIRKSIFRGNVRVYHLPSDTPDVKVDATNLPEVLEKAGGMYMECTVLTVLSKPLADGKTSQEMHAKERVFFRTKEFFGRATDVNYDDVTERVIFKGSDGNPAMLFQVVQPGDPPKTIRGKTIIYDRKTGSFRLDGGTEIKWSRLENRGPAHRQFAGSGADLMTNGELLAVTRLHADRQDQAFAGLAAEGNTSANRRRGGAGTAGGA